MGKIKKIFGGGKPDTSALREQEKRLAQQEKKLAAEEKSRKEQEAKKKKATLQARQGQRGARSLLSGLETGVSPEDEKRPNLG